MAKTRQPELNFQNQQLSTLLFADDQVMIADTEDNLQKAVHKLNQIVTEYGLTILTYLLHGAEPLLKS